MRTVVFVAPFALPTTRRVIEAVARLADVRVIAMLQEHPQEPLSCEVWICPAVLDDASLTGCLDRLVRQVGLPHRLLGILEALQEPLARQRARLGIEGMRPETANRFRDKDRMKACLREAGVGVAASCRVDAHTTADEILERVGLPLVLKPLAGAGAVATVRVDDAAGLRTQLAALPRPLIAETFLSGAEHSMEVLVRGGEVLFHSVTRYLPSALEVSNNPHLQWVVHLPRDTSAFADAVPQVTRAVLALGMDTGIAHAEWFRMPDGRVLIGEIGARPPGAGFLDLHSHAHEADWFDAWARLVVDGTFAGPWPRRWSVAGVYLRGPGRGRVAAVEGLERAQRDMGIHVVEARLPQIGQPRRDGYEGEGFVVIRHRDDDTVREAALSLIRTVRVHYA